MIDSATEAYLLALSQAIALNTGLSFPRERWNDLNRVLTKAAADLGFENINECAQWLLEPVWSDNRIENLAPYLTIGETHFFRDRKLFQALEEKILPDLIKAGQFNGRRMKFWSAGCATGEEPYSLAVLIDKIIQGAAGWDITVLATDINRNSLQKANEGMYTQWSFREVPKGIRGSYFREKRDRIEIIADIKRMVTFDYLNLAKDLYPHSGNNTEAIDLIFCRNVLMYFTAERQKTVLDNLCRCLVDGGWLIVSPAEASIVDNPHLVAANIPGAVLFRKISRHSGKRRRLQPAPAIVQPKVPETPALQPIPFWWAPPAELLPAEPSVDTSNDNINVQPPIADTDAAPEEDGLELYNQKLYSEAAEKFARELEMKQWQGPERDSKISLLIRSYGNQGKLDEALEWAEKALATNILNAEHHYLSGMILQAKGLFEEAAVSLNKAIFLDPDFVVAHFALGNLAFARGNRKESDRHHKTALRTLTGWADDVIVPGSDGMTAGKLKDIITTMKLKERPHAHR